MRLAQVMCVVVGCAMAGSVAQAKSATKPSPSAQMNKLIGNVCAMELGNGAYAFRSYNPGTFKRQDAIKLITKDMRTSKHAA